MKKYLFILMLSLGLVWGSQVKAAETPIASTKAIEALVTAFSFNTDGTFDMTITGDINLLVTKGIFWDDTKIFERSNDVIAIDFAASNNWNITASSISSFVVGGARLQQSGVSSTIPTIIPNAGDINTGIGQAAEDQLSLIAGTLEAARFVEDNGATIGIISANSIIDAFLVGNQVEIGKWAGDGVSAGSITITDVGGGAHGLSLAVGDLAYITNSTTSGDEGLYRIVSDDGTSVVVDRALSGSDTDLTVFFYKDVIAFGASDGTDGQRIANYSHQDKPLQIGGDTLEATGHSLGSEDVLIGGNLFEINAVTWFDDTVNIGSPSTSGTDTFLLAFDDNVGTPTMGANDAGLYNNSGEMIAIDEDENVTQLTGNTNDYPDEMSVSTIYSYVSPIIQNIAGVKVFKSENKGWELLQQLAKAAGILPQDEYIIKYSTFTPTQSYTERENNRVIRRDQKIADIQARIVSIAAQITQAEAQIALVEAQILQEEDNETIIILKDKKAGLEKTKSILENTQIEIPKPYKRQQPSKNLKSMGVVLEP